MVTSRKTKGKKFYIGVDVGGTKISAALVGPSGQILARDKYSTLQGAKPSTIGCQVEDIIQEILSDAKIKSNAIYGIGLGIPGIVDAKTNKILVTPNIQLAGYPLSQNLRKKFRVKVLLGNDANLGLLAEKWLGAGKKAQNLVGLFLGTGVGGGIIIDGKLYTGSQGVAAELGHMIIDINSKVLNAGLLGTLEALASRRAIERQIREAIRAGKKTILTELTGGNLKTIKSKLIYKALKKKDPFTVRIMNDLCGVLGKACISLRHILNPDMIIFGGGLIEACGEYILPRVKKISDQNPFLAGIDRCAIVQSVLGDDAVIYGAVALLKQSENKGVI